MSNLIDDEFAEFIEKAPDMYLSVCAETAKILRCNKTMASALGCKKEDILGRPIFDLYHPDSRSDVERAFQQFVTTGSIFGAELQMLRQDGSTIDVSVNATAIRDEQGRIVASRSAVRDISDRKQAERKLIENEARLQRMLDHMPQLMWTSGLDKKCTYFNQQWLSYTGRPIEQELGDGWADGVHPDDIDHCLATYVSAFDARKPFDMEYRLRGADGQYRSFYDSGMPWHDDDGEFGGYIGSCVDITHRKEIEIELRESKEFLQTIIETEPDCVKLLGCGGEILMMNRSGLKLIGKSSLDEVRGQCVYDIVSTEHRDAYRSMIDRVFAGEAGSIQIDMVGHTGARMSLEVRAVPMRDVDGHITSALGITRDMTELKRAESDRAARLHHLDTLDRVNAVISRATSVDKMLDDVVGEILTSLRCDRVWLSHPCDTNAESIRIPFERTTPDFPGLGSPELDMPVNDDIRAMMTLALEQPGPVPLSPEKTRELLGPQMCDAFRIKSLMIMAIHPRVGPSWTLGFHQCTHTRTWLDEDRRLVQDVGRRLEDALSSMLILRELRASESQFRTLCELAPVGIFFNDTSGDCVFVNQNCAETLGRPAEECVGDKWASSLHPDDRDRVYEKWMETLAQGGFFFDHYRFVRPDGEVRWVEVNVIPRLDATGKVNGYIGTMVDTTERRKLESEVLEISAAEQRRIGQDLHDSVGQELTGLGLLAGLLVETLDQPNHETSLDQRRAKRLIESARKLSNGIGHTHETVRMLSKGMVPVEVDKHGLMVALDDLAKSINEVHELSCRFECDRPVDCSNNFQSMHLYRIAQEAVNNAIKHSHADHVHIKLKQADDKIVLQVIDDGSGLDIERSATSGLGLRTMRYRAEHIGAKLDFQSNDEGTTIACAVVVRSEE